MSAPICRSISETYIAGTSRAVVVLECDYSDVAGLIAGADISQLSDAALTAVADAAAAAQKAAEVVSAAKSTKKSDGAGK